MEGRYYYRRMDLSILYHMKTEDAYMHYILNWQYVAIILQLLTVSGLQAHTSRCLRVSGNIRNGIRLYSRKGLRILPPKQVYNEYCVL